MAANIKNYRGEHHATKPNEQTLATELCINVLDVNKPVIRVAAHTCSTMRKIAEDRFECATPCYILYRNCNILDATNY